MTLSCAGVGCTPSLHPNVPASLQIGIVQARARVTRSEESHAVQEQMEVKVAVGEASAAPESVTQILPEVDMSKGQSPGQKQEDKVCLQLDQPSTSSSGFCSQCCASNHSDCSLTEYSMSDLRISVSSLIAIQLYNRWT